MARAAAILACGLALALLASVRPGRAWAAGGRVDPGNRLVVLARLSDADATIVEALARVSGELVAAGFHIRSLPISRDVDARSTVESIGRELDPVAAFAIFPGPATSGGAPTAEIWVSDRLEGRSTVQRLLVEKGVCTPEEFASKLRAIDLEDGVADGRSLPR